MTKAVNEREIILDILLMAEIEKMFINDVLTKALKKYAYLDKRERSFISSMVQGIMENKIHLDYIINYFSKTKINKMKPLIRNVIRMGVYQIKYMDSVPDSAACNESVKLVRKRGLSGLSGFVNGVLRNISRNIDTVKYPKKDSIEWLSIEYSVPEFIINQWIEQYSRESAIKILENRKQNKKMSISVNVLRITTEELTKRLINQGIKVEPGLYIKDSLYISDYNSLVDIEEFNQGLFYIQDESSMLAMSIVNPEKNTLVIDACSSPGGKSIYLAMHNDSIKIIARDISDNKVQRIRENIERLQIENIEPQIFDALLPDKELEGEADYVIADLPCSGLGVINKKSDIVYNVTRESIDSLIELQRGILNSIEKMVKPGGYLIYSTCTTNKEENEENLRWFLSEYRYETQSLKGLVPESICKDDKGYVQLLNGIKGTDGFFMARLKKIE